MNTLLVILMLGLMAATLFALIRGIIAFLKTTEQDLMNPGAGPSQSAMKQNRAMFQRIFFQGAAIMVMAVILLMRR